MDEEGYQAIKVTEARDSPFEVRDSPIQKEHFCLSPIPAASDDLAFFNSLMFDGDDFMIGNSDGNFISGDLDADNEVETGVKVPVSDSAVVVNEVEPMVIEDNVVVEEESTKNESHISLPILQFFADFGTLISSLPPHVVENFVCIHANFSPKMILTFQPSILVVSLSPTLSTPELPILLTLPNPPTATPSSPTQAPTITPSSPPSTASPIEIAHQEH